MADIVKLISPPKTASKKEKNKFLQNVADCLSYIAYAGNPTGTILPRWVNDRCLDTTTSNWYVSSGVGVNDWHSSQASGLTSPVGLSDGGTGGTTAAAARSNLSVGDKHADGSESAPSISFANDSDCGIHRIGSNEWALVVGGSRIMRFKKDSGGNMRFGFETEFGGVHAPFFQIDDRYAVPSLLINNLLATGLQDTADIALRRINGTNDSPTGMKTLEWAGQVYWWPFDGTGYLPGPVYGAAQDSSTYDSEVGDGTTGPFSFTVELGDDSPSDIAVFVEETGTFRMDHLKVLNDDYTFTYNNGTNALSVTFASGHEPQANETIWVFKRFDWCATAPFYGRQGGIRVISTQTPSQTGRGGVNVIYVTKNDEVCERPRFWISQSGNTIIGAQAVAEVDPAVGRYYPDRANTGGSARNGCPSGFTPVDWDGTGMISIPMVDKAVNALLSFREWDNLGSGWDILWDESSSEFVISTVSGGSRTERWRINADGDLLPSTDSSVDIGETSKRIANIYADALVGTGLDKLVDRGDPSAYDWAVGDFTTDDTWRDLDCSSIVPSGAVAIKLRVQAISNDAGSIIAFRKNGNSNSISQASVRTQVSALVIEGDLTVFCDTNRVIEYKGTYSGGAATFSTLNVAVVGWTLAP